jgi:hypothetical protein
LKQLFWYGSQVAVFGATVYLCTRPEALERGGNNPQADLLLAVAATMCYMAVIWTVGEGLSWVRSRLRRPRSKSNDTDQRESSRAVRIGPRELSKLPPSPGVSQNARHVIDAAPKLPKINSFLDFRG